MEQVKQNEIEYDGPYPQDETTAWLILPGKPDGNIVPAKYYAPTLRADGSVITRFEDLDDEAGEKLYRTVQTPDGTITWQVMVFTADLEVAR